MRLLLINKNPVVSRMMQMGVPKAGFEIEECDSIYELPKGTFDVVIIDDEMYDENLLQTLRQQTGFKKIGVISFGKNKIEGIDFILHKPFLPTDLLELLRDIKAEIESSWEEQPVPLAPFDESDEEKESIVEVEEVEEESPFVEEPLEKSGVLKEEEVAEVASLLEEEPPKEEQVEPLQESHETVEVDKQDVLGEQPRTEEAVETEANERATMEEQEKSDKLQEVQKEIRSLGVQGLREILDGMQLEITIKISYPDRKDV